MYYRIEGSRVSLYEKYMITQADGKIRVVSHPGQSTPEFIPKMDSYIQRGVVIAPGTSPYAPVNPLKN
jgi:hypothetical protein